MSPADPSADSVAPAPTARRRSRRKKDQPAEPRAPRPRRTFQEQLRAAEEQVERLRGRRRAELLDALDDAHRQAERVRQLAQEVGEQDLDAHAVLGRELEQLAAQFLDRTRAALTRAAAPSEPAVTEPPARA